MAASSAPSDAGRGAAGALVASRCAANKRALSATPQARLLGQCELARWELGPGNASASAADVQWSRFGLTSSAGVHSVVHPRHRAGSAIFRSLDASTRGFWSVYDSSELLARLHAAEHGADRPVPPAVASFRIKPEAAEKLNAFANSPENVHHLLRYIAKRRNIANVPVLIDTTPGCEEWYVW